MKRLVMIITLGLALLSLVSIVSALGEYDLSWWTVDGGGATFSSGGGYELGGTMGQPDAGRLSGGDFTLGGGFWGGGAAVEPATPTATPTSTATPTPTPTGTPTTPTTTLTSTATPTATPTGTVTPPANLIYLPLVFKNWSPPPTLSILLGHNNVEQGLFLDYGGHVDTEVVSAGSPPTEARRTGNGQALPAPDGNQVLDSYVPLSPHSPWGRCARPAILARYGPMWRRAQRSPSRTTTSPVPR
jgi:hypothetical protein